MQKILGQSQDSNDKKDTNGKRREEPRKQFNFVCGDPNAMNIDALTIKKRGEIMKKGLCFNCEKLSRDCPNKKKAGTSQSPPSYTHQHQRNWPLKSCRHTSNP